MIIPRALNSITLDKILNGVVKMNLRFDMLKFILKMLRQSITKHISEEKGHIIFQYILASSAYNS